MNTFTQTIEEEIPRLRGMLHVIAAPAFLLAGCVAALSAGTAREAVACLIMVLGFCGIFSASAIYHRVRCAPRRKRLLRSIDHGMIFVGMACAYTALWLALLDGMLADVMLGYVWIGALIGVVMKVRYLDARSSRHAIAYVAFGLVGIVLIPSLWQVMGAFGVSLMVAGALAFVAGAIAFGAKRPNPFPGLVGHHEVFHAATIIGATLHVFALLVAVQ